LAIEEPLQIDLITGPQGDPQRHTWLVTMRTPGYDYELTAGLLFSEGIIDTRKDIVKMVWCNEPDQQNYNLLQVRLSPNIEWDPQKYQRNLLSQSSCGICGQQSIEHLKAIADPNFDSLKPQISSEAILSMNTTLKQAQPAFLKTGGIHAAALFNTQGELLQVREDIGRHNAVDKLVGWAILESIPNLNQQVLVLSGRSSFEVIQKSIKAHLPIVVTVGAPSSLAVHLSQAYRQTLIGFLKASEFNIYSGFERVSPE